MLKNYLKTALRNLRRNKSYAFINIVGLSVGIAACLLIFLVVSFELSFDSFHKNKNHIYRLATEFNGPDGKSYSAGVPMPVAKTLRIDFPQLKKVASIFKMGDEQVTVLEDGKKQTEKKFIENGIYYTEPEFFEIFDFKWLAGSSKSALSEPNSVVLSKAIAEKYFGDWKTAIGKSIKQANRYVYKVSGILDDIPSNSDFPLQIVVSFSSLKNTDVNSNLDDWVSTFSGAYCFVLLPENLSASKFDALLPAFVKKYKPAEYAKDGLVTQPLSQIHFDRRFGNYSGSVFSKELITVISLIGIFLLLIACVNFINLATAQAVNRSKEVGVRKVLGSNRRQLALQFLSETFLITFFAVLLALSIAELTLPLLNNLLRTSIKINLFSEPVLLLFLAVIILLVTVLSGLYPAIILSGFNPITALKSKITARMVGGISLRRGLVIMQFTIAQVLIIGTLIVVSQMDYFRTASLGFDQNAIVTVSIPSDSLSNSKIPSLQNRLINSTGIKKLSFSFASPADNGNWNSDFKFNHSPKATDFGANLKWADADYFKMYDIQFVAGKSYFPSDTVREFVVNETLLKKLGIINPQEAIGKQIDFWDGQKKGNIVGVIKDFHARSLRNPIVPVVLSTWQNVYHTINIKIKPENIKETMASIEKIWTDTYPEFVYQYQFLDEKIANFYAQENQLSKLYKIFAALAIFISCLGLYGLVSFMAVQRTKEVGIRKVLGASVGHIIYLFSKEFTILIFIAFVVASPIAYYFMHQWLQNFEFRVTPGPAIFLVAISIAIGIAWLTVGYRAIRAAVANPVKSLRTE